MSASASSSSAYTTNYNTQTTGAAGANSPTVTTQGDVSITDAGQTANAINGIGQIAMASLNLLSSFNSGQAVASVQQNKDNTDLLSTILQDNQTLAANVQSGGATTGMALTTKVVIGALALMGLLVAVLLFRK